MDMLESFILGFCLLWCSCSYVCCVMVSQQCLYRASVKNASCWGSPNTSRHAF